jgi:hypothetical protein
MLLFTKFKDQHGKVVILNTDYLKAFEEENRGYVKVYVKGGQYNTVPKDTIQWFTLDEKGKTEFIEPEEMLI